MTSQERNRLERINSARVEKAREIRRRQATKCRMTLLLTALFIVTIGSVIFGSNFSAAKNNVDQEARYKYYKSIEIQPGDSLWAIAEKCSKDTDLSTKEYLKEIKELNGLENNTIYAGQHIIITYYDTKRH